MRRLLAFIIMVVLIISCQSGKISNVEQLNKSLLKGWNTFENRSILTQVLMPEGLAFTVQIHDTLKGDSLYFAFTGNRVKGSEWVRPKAHTPDGSYTDFEMTWRDFDVRVQTVSDKKDVSFLITPNDKFDNSGFVSVRGEMVYGDEGSIKRTSDALTAQLPKKTLVLKSITPANSELSQSMKNVIAYSTNTKMTLEQLQNEIDIASKLYQKDCERAGKHKETWNAIQNAMNWLVVHDPQKDRAISPVSRPWSYGWGNGEPGGYVLFCWDNFFAAYMHSINSKKLAFNEAIQMCREIDDLGFVPNFSSLNNLKSRDRSQPPVGSMMVLEVYKRYPEKWFLEACFDRLLKWNRWWEEKRDYNGYLCWGSNSYEPILNDKREKVMNVFKAASYESGLDNTPMYDGVAFNKETHLLEMGDVGLMGMYVGDCEALVKMAKILNRPEDAKELAERAEKYRTKIKTMWDEEFGLFLNVHTDTGEKSKRISPTNFYALIAKAATNEQAERMMKEHFYNPEEFWGEWIMPSVARNDTAYTGQDYWRGSIWAPMNFLVYWGMRNYDLPQAKRDLADQSNKLLMKQWLERGYIRENYHAETGGFNPRSEHFYHWGALLGMIVLLEYGYF